jgi:hypothetical protein
MRKWNKKERAFLTRVVAPFALAVQELAAACKNTHLLFSFPYVCPEPVLVK